MSFTTLQNTPIEIDLLSLVNDNGWTLNGNTATHESCNDGTITYNEPFIANEVYDVSIQIVNISGGLLNIGLGNAVVSYTTAGFKQFTLTSTTATPYLSLYSNANCTVSILSIRKQEADYDISPTSTNTIVYSQENKKWVSFVNYNPDTGFSLFTNLYTFKDAVMYGHTDKVNRNKYYGAEYDSRVNLPFAGNGTKTFQSIAIHCNELLITTENGIKTSLGQVSDLVAKDFEQFILDDGVTTVSIYDREGVSTANFLRDSNTNILTGDRLKGRWTTIELTTTTEKDFKLFKVVLKSQVSTPAE